VVDFTKQKNNFPNELSGLYQFGDWVWYDTTQELEWPRLEINLAADLTRITVDPKLLVGKPVIRGTRLSVEFIIGLLADGWTEKDILDNYPGIEIADIKACLAYARDALSNERVYPTAAE
jgi:uncharacterized protein (DUF433 family)